jgi:predicted phage terminase large subunit-like protein
MHWLFSLNGPRLAASSPGMLGMYASRGRWNLFRHLALYNRIALAIAAGLVSNVFIEVQPQTGKSQFWSKHFPAWWLGTFPEKRVGVSSYESSYAASWGRATRDLLEEHGETVFGVKVRQDSRAVDEWQLAGHDGGMVTAGVGGPLTGRPLDLGIIDDPIKNAEEASSEAHLAKIFDWYDSVFSTRFHEGAVKVILMTRWSEKDLIGRIKARAAETKEPWLEIRLPAIAEEDEAFHIKHPDGRIEDLGWHRKKGEVLCPELYSQETMEQRRANTLDFWWATLYQQRPYPREGGEFKASWFKIVDDVPHLDMVCRSWDLAGSEDKNAAQTAGCKMGRVGHGDKRQYFITDFVAGWWSSGTRDKEICSTAETDGRAVHQIVEQEPGSGGKVQAEGIARQLDGFKTHIVVAGSEGSKQLRADPMGSAAQVGKVFIKRAAWNAAFQDQIRRFPGGKPIDMVDAAAQAFNWLSEQPNPEFYSPDEVLGPEKEQIFGAPEGGIFS